MLRIGLTGGIGSGKSTVAAMLADHGAHVIDADAVAREVVSPGSAGLGAVVAEFGPDVLAADGSLDRAALAARVFADQDARQRLNEIMHPLIGQRTAELMAQVPDDGIVVHDVPLLAELQLQGVYDAVIVVDCPDEVRLRRLGERGLTEQDARSRMAAQATREQRLAIADFVVDNAGDLGATRRQVERIWPQIAAGPAG